MQTIIGLGQAGCNVADKFAEYPQYKVYKIDAGLEKCIYMGNLDAKRDSVF